MKDLQISEVCKIVKCHRNTVLEYERRGLIHPARDVNGYRRFSQADAEKLKALLSARWTEQAK